METGAIIIFILYLFVAGFFVGLGIPCSMGLVRPNRLYGFRTPKTLHDRDVWYATNRVAGYWELPRESSALVFPSQPFSPG